MCRIIGIISKHIPLDKLVQKAELMSRGLEHGGPDDKGIFSDEEAGVVFGHRRLSIIDLSSNGHQPMADFEKKVWITFNGEIYNYPELKIRLLNLGAKFHSNTDTEVIISAFLHWGPSAFAMLKGMFAFALYDKVNSITYLVRDSAGIKPLYYQINGGSLTFASEVKAFKLADSTIETDEHWPVRFLAFGHIPEPYTTLKNVYSLQKGNYLTWHHQKCTFNIKPFVNNTNPTAYISKIETVKELINNTLLAAVNRQLIADAPIGVFLSGGVDSSLVTLLASQHQKQQLKTISIYFNEKEYNERQFQELVTKGIKGEKFTHLVNQQNFELYFPRIMADMDMPTTDGINTWFISKYAKEDGLKAVLSGLGADELFGGYPSFNRIKYLNYLRKIPASFFNAAKYLNTDRYRKVSFLAHSNPLADYLFLRGLFIPEDIAKILDLGLENVNEVLFNSQTIAETGNYDDEHAAWFESNLYMQNQLLRDTDVMSMAHGLEVRVPFLDDDFRELVKNISPEIRFNKKQPKKILIDSFANLIPPAIWKRPKMGFSFPLQAWMGVHAEMSNENNYKGKYAQNAVKKFKNGRLHWSKVFALYQIQSRG